jgi:hypothetical protein
MQIEANTPRVERTIADFKVQVPQPYAAGQPLTEATAAILNQTFSENISNNTRAKLALGHVPEGSPEGTEATPHTAESAQALIDRYVEQYEPGVRRGGSGVARVTDPVEKEARNIAKDKARELVKARGLKPADVNLSEIADKVYEANKDALTAAAKKIVAARTKGSSDDGLQLDGLFDSPEAQPEAEG